MPCGLYPEDCGADHVAPVLHLRCTTPGQWTGTCPACRRAGKLSLAAGTNGRRFVWLCHYRPACAQAAVHEAMLAAGVSEACIPVSRGRHRQRASVITAADAAAWIELPAPAIRLRLTMFALDCGPWEASAKLGLSRSAAYRAISPVPKSGTEPQVAPVPKSGIVKRSTDPRSGRSGAVS